MEQNNLSSELKAEGVKIKLNNGTEVTLKYGMAALAELEKKHGSISGLVETFDKVDKGPVISTLTHALWAGTSRKVSYEAFLDLLDPKSIQEYADAFQKAFGEAMGYQESGEPDAK